MLSMPPRKRRVTRAGMSAESTRPRNASSCTQRIFFIAALSRASGTCLPESHTCANASHPLNSTLPVPPPDNMTLAYGMVVSAGIIACVCLVCGAGVSYASDDNTSNSMKGFGMALLIGFFLLPTAVVTIALTATTLGLGLA